MHINNTIKACALGIITTIILTGCSQKVSLSEPWTTDECDSNLKNALEQIDKYSVRVEDKRVKLEDLERRGGYEKAANQLRIDIGNLKQGRLAGNLHYIDEEVFMRCDKSKLDPALLERVEKAREFINSEEASFTAEDVPDLRVTNVTSEFVPYIEYPENGSCAGPFMDLKFTVTNFGADFPRAVDWENYTNLYEKGQVSPAPEQVSYISISSDLDFTSSGRHETEGTTITRDEFNDGIFNSGESYTYETRVPVYDNETSLTVTARASSAHGLLTASTQGIDIPFEETFEIPIWDIYPSAALTLRNTDADGAQTVQTSLYMGNNGKTGTPGPIYGNFTVHNSEDESAILGWSGDTGQNIPESISGIPITQDAETGEAHSTGKPSFAILGEKKTPRVSLEKDLIVKASVLLLCPSGKTGDLHDGDSSNNTRTLKTN